MEHGHRGNSARVATWPASVQVRLSVLPPMSEPGAPPGRCARCCGYFRRGKKERLSQYQEQVLDSASEE